MLQNSINRAKIFKMLNLIKMMRYTSGKCGKY